MIFFSPPLLLLLPACQVQQMILLPSSSECPALPPPPLPLPPQRRPAALFYRTSISWQRAAAAGWPLLRCCECKRLPFRDCRSSRIRQHHRRLTARLPYGASLAPQCGHPAQAAAAGIPPPPPRHASAVPATAITTPPPLSPLMLPPPRVLLISCAGGPVRVAYCRRRTCLPVRRAAQCVCDPAVSGRGRQQGERRRQRQQPL